MNRNSMKRLVMPMLALLLVMAFAVPLASAAGMYGRTEDKVRVRESASTNAAVIDNIVEDACVYVTESKGNGSTVFVRIKYVNKDGDTASGWVCKTDGKTTYVTLLSATQAKSQFGVSDGKLPSKRVGTFTEKQRKASVASSDNTYIKEGTTNSTTVKDLQTKLKALGYYYGEITGNVGEKTKAAIKQFQSKNGLTADGIAGPQTLAKVDAVYASKGSTSSSSTSASTGSGLKQGSSGIAVRNLQKDLTTLGFYWAEITGNYGAKTETAVKRFQEENGLKADGVAGTKTLEAVAAAIAKKGGSSAGSSSSASSGSTLKLNSQGNAVTTLQQNLKQLGYYYADITGNFGSKTEAAVKEFQKDKKLTADGVAGGKTLDAIKKAISEAGGSSYESGSSESGLKVGSTGDAVRALQQNLTTLGYYYGDITGHYGSMTQTAVKKFQSKYGLSADGVAGSKTISAVESAVKNNGSVVAGGSSSSSSGSLRLGDSGNEVKELQTMLYKLGIYYGDITGNFGSLTQRAVRAFQDKYDLTVDGIAGLTTINKLRSLTGNGSSSTGTSSGSTVSTENSYGRTTKDNVYLRSSYSTTSAAKTSLDKGTKFRISKMVISGGEKWYYISVKVGKYSYNGYVRSDMMETIKESEYGDTSNNPSDMETLGVLLVTGTNVNLRYSPSTDAQSVGTAGKGETFYYVDSTAGWYQTKSGYWISSDYARPMTADELKDYGGTTSNGGTVSYKLGSTGTEVSRIQTMLTELGYYDREITGRYGNHTHDAVQKFQRANGLSGDGIVGAKTMAKMEELYLKKIGGTGGSASYSYNSTIFNIGWFKLQPYFSALGFKSGNKAVLIDINTNKALNIHIQSCGNHIDAEPLTANDTATLCSIFGVSSSDKINYVRRSMVVEIDGKQYVCSIYGEAHGQQDITNNNYNGQFCLHLLDSKTHGTDRVDNDTDGHQEMIKKGVSTLTNSRTDAKGGKITISTDLNDVIKKKSM